MRDDSPDQKRSRAYTLRCTALILALLAASHVSHSQTSSPVAQLQHTTNKEVEKRRTETCYAVQVGAYKNRAEVGAMLDKLAQAFPYRMTLTQVGTRAKTRWRLRVLATSRVEALQFSEQLLAQQGVQAWIVPIPCSHWDEGRLDGAILAPRAETREPSSPTLMKEVAVLHPREARVSTTAPKTENPVPVSEPMVWEMTIATFLGTTFFVLLICIVCFQRGQIREALRNPSSNEREKPTPARVLNETLHSSAPTPFAQDGKESGHPEQTLV